MLDIPKTWEVHHDILTSKKLHKKEMIRLKWYKRNSDWVNKVVEIQIATTVQFPMSRDKQVPGMSAAAWLRSHHILEIWVVDSRRDTLTLPSFSYVWPLAVS